MSSKFTCNLGEITRITYRHLPAKGRKPMRVLIEFTHTFDVKSDAFRRSIKALGGRARVREQEVVVTFAVKSARDAASTADKAMRRFREQMGWCANSLPQATKGQKQRVIKPHMLRPMGT